MYQREQHRDYPPHRQSIWQKCRLQGIENHDLCLSSAWPVVSCRLNSHCFRDGRATETTRRKEPAQLLGSKFSALEEQVKIPQEVVESGRWRGRVERQPDSRALEVSIYGSFPLPKESLRSLVPP